MKLKPLFFIFAAVALLHSTSLGTLISAVNSLCVGMGSLLPVAAMLMTLLAAVIYAAGQMMGAETRARANVWATAALTGAMMAVLITAITPTVLSTIYGPTISCSGGSGTTPPGGCPIVGQIICKDSNQVPLCQLPIGCGHAGCGSGSTCCTCSGQCIKAGDPCLRA